MQDLRESVSSQIYLSPTMAGNGYSKVDLINLWKNLYADLYDGALCDSVVLISRDIHKLEKSNGIIYKPRGMHPFSVPYNLYVACVSQQ